MNFSGLELIGLVILVFAMTIALVNVLTAMAYAIGYVIYAYLRCVHKHKHYIKLAILPFTLFIQGFIEGFFSPITVARSSKWIWYPPFGFVKVSPKVTVIVDEHNDY